MSKETETTPTSTEQPKVVTISSSVADAVSSVSAEEKKDETTEKKVEPAAEKKDEKKEPEKKESQETVLNEVELEQAKQLFEALKDPNKAPIVIKFIAEQAGYTKAETKQEAKVVKDEILDTLKESLGTDFDFLADKLAPAISKIVDMRVKENTKDIRSTIEGDKEKELQAAADRKQTILAKEFFDAEVIPDDFLDDMSKMMDKIPATKDMSVEDYVETVFYAVAGKRHVTPATKTSKDRIDRNKNDATSRLVSSGAKSPDATPVGSKRMSLDEAVKAAVEAVKEE